jgi:preprotein translocase subunit SecE
MPETMEEKQVQPPSAPSPAPRLRLLRLLKAWIGVIGVAWGATLAHALSRWDALGAATVRLGRWELSPAGLGAGVVLGVALIAFGLKRFGPRLEYVKPGQGRWVRLSAIVFVGALTAFGCYAFYQLPSLTSSWWLDVVRKDLFGKALALKPILFPSVGIFATVMFVVYLLLNQEKWAEFLIETEGELKKVSWPPRKEYVGSAVVVVLVVVVISVFLHFVDKGLSGLMKGLGIGF